VAGVPWPPASECRVVVACAVPFMTYAPGMTADAATLQLVYDAQQAEAKRLATAACERIARPDLVSTSTVTFGRLASTILDVADQFAPNLLVVGSRGLGPLTSALLGSVSEELVDHAACAVLVARGAVVRRVVLAEDGSPDARAAGTLLLRWPMFDGCEIRVVSVAETPERHAPGATAAGNAARQVAQEVLATAHDRAQGTADRLTQARLRADTAVRQGDPAAEILAEAVDWSADLILIGTRGQTGLTRVLHGSVARKLLEHARCSVLVERQR